MFRKQFGCVKCLLVSLACVKLAHAETGTHVESTIATVITAPAITTTTTATAITTTAAAAAATTNIRIQ